MWTGLDNAGEMPNSLQNRRPLQACFPSSGGRKRDAMNCETFLNGGYPTCSLLDKTLQVTVFYSFNGLPILLSLILVTCDATTVTDSQVSA